MTRTFGSLYALAEAFKSHQEKESQVSLPDPYGTDITVDSGITKTHVFVTKFFQGDVAYFTKLLKENPPTKHRDDLDYQLRSGLQDWCDEHPGESPYEPFLWALKITDNYVGASIQTNAVPQPWIIEDIGETLLSLWNEHPKTHLRVIHNVLESWDWYQPVHVVLYLYQRLTEVNSDELDKLIRDYWLYRALYSTSAFYCLCEKRKSEENIRALLSYVSRDVQMDSNMAEISITKKMRYRIAEYLNYASEEEYQQGKTYYVDVLYNCSKRARELFNGVFQLTNTDNQELAHLISEWEKGIKDGEAESMKRNVIIQFRRNPINLIEDASRSHADGLHQQILHLVGQAPMDFSKQHLLRRVASCSPRCDAYAQYITQEYEQLNGRLKDEKSFVLSCAYCLLGHPEIIESLAIAHYLNSVGARNGVYIFHDIRLKYSRQYNEQIFSLTKLCLEDTSRALALCSSCSKIYSRRTASWYPVMFDRVSDKLLQCLLEDEEGCVRYANVLMDLYERVATSQNRDRYRNQLQMLIGTRAVVLQPVRKRANKVMDYLYRAL